MMTVIQVLVTAFEIFVMVTDALDAMSIKVFFFLWVGGGVCVVGVKNESRLVKNR